MNATIHNFTAQSLILDNGFARWALSPGSHDILLPDAGPFSLSLTSNPTSQSITGFPGIVISAGLDPSGNLDLTTSRAEASDAALFGTGFAIAIAIRTPFLALHWFKRLTSTSSE